MNKTKYSNTSDLLTKSKSFFSITTKQITYGAIFSASSVAIVIMLMTFTPILALPNLRVSFEGILIKISGYLFGPIIGCLTGIISELLVNTLRPVFFNVPYTLIIVFYGIFGGIIKILNSKSKRPELLFFSLSTIFIAIFMCIFIFLIKSRVFPFLVFGVKFYSAQSLIIFVVVLEGVVFLTLPLLKFLTFVVFKRGQNFYYEILPIYILAIFTSFLLTIPIASWGDTQLFLKHLSTSKLDTYINAILLEIVITPLNIFTNMFVIYFVWKIINVFIYNQQLGKYSRNTMDIKFKSNPFEKLFLVTKKNNNSKKHHDVIKFRLIQKLSNINFFKNKKVITIAGTNGKGTVANFIYHYLVKREYSCGLFVGPHIMKWNERIKYNWKSISEQDLSQIYPKIYKYIKLYNLKTFESLFLVALFLFSKKNVKIMILECGIGARNDIVGQVNNNYSAISNVNIEHTKILGKTKEEIAIDKSYVIKNRSKCFIFEGDKNIKKIYSQRIKHLSNVNIVNLDNANNNIVSKKDGFLIQIKKETILYKDPFYFNAQNILLAAYIAHEITSENIINIIKKMSQIKFFGRNTTTTFNNNNYIINVAHNYSAIKQVIKVYSGKKLNNCAFLLSLSQDKEITKIIKIFSKDYGKLFLCKNSSERSFIPQQFKIHPDINVINDLEKWILKNTKYENVFRIGSFFFISDIMKFIDNRKN